mmetsp:Transcript_33884/g.71254  ORF Transcript_33884/g.71254 Transcript_33884/m.71254 type:complete len:421 (+) Transcript_33884:34-1296(+)
MRVKVPRATYLLISMRAMRSLSICLPSLYVLCIMVMEKQHFETPVFERLAVISEVDVYSVDCRNTDLRVEEIQVHVIGWRRPGQTKALLEQLEKSNYVGWNTSVPLYIHLDGGADKEVITISEEFHWTHGEKQLDVQPKNVGLREMWLSSLGSAAKSAGENTLMIIFEDDMSTSSIYFQWILSVVDAYGRNKRCRDSKLMGFSLSPIRVDEMTKPPFKRWDATQIIGRDLAYLSVVPSSWGAAYWSDRWNEFMEFVNVRVEPPYYDMNAEENLAGMQYDDLKLTPKELYLPDARSNVWPKSWKRFMVDWMYVRGLVMLYPNLPEEMALATTMALAGEHVGASTKNNPRVSELIVSFDRLTGTVLLPEYRDLVVLDLHNNPTTFEELALSGTKFLKHVQASCLYCNDLLRVWAFDVNAIVN